MIEESFNTRVTLEMKQDATIESPKDERISVELQHAFDEVAVRERIDATVSSEVIKPYAKTPKPKWEKPDIALELGEIERTAEELGIAKNILIEAYEKAKLELLSDKDWEQMLNSDSRDTTWEIEEIRLHLKDKRDFSRIEQGLKAGAKLPTPIVLYRENKPPYLIGGNSRLLGCRALNLRPTVLALRI